MGALIPILAAVLGGAASSYVGNKTAPKQPRYPTFGGQSGAYGAQNPAVMQMLSALMGQQQQGQAQRQASQQQILQQLMMSMMMNQPQVGQRQGNVQIGPVSPLPRQ